MVKRLKEILMQAGKVASIDFVVIHNDAGGSSWTGQSYIDWLRGRDKTLGIAHFYITRDDIAQVLEIGDIGYHTGEWWSNTHSIGYEICHSHDQYGVDNDTFKLNEEMCLRKVAEDMKALGLPVNRDTVRLHREFVPTSCPNRSWTLHGQDVNAVKDYFISRIKYYMSLGDTVEEMLENKKKKTEESEELLKSKGGTIMFVVKLMEDHDNKNKKGDFFLFNVLNNKYIHVSPAQYALIAPLITAGAIPEVKSYKVAPHFTAIVTQGKFAPGSWEQVYNGK